MYDRKTWIVVCICSALLAANIYYSNQRQQAKRAQAAAEQAAAAEKQAAEKPADTDAAGKPAEPAPKPEASSEKPAKPTPPAAKEVLSTIETGDAKFVFTNIGGGVKEASMKRQFEVHSTEKPVRINRFGTEAVGSLSEGADRFDALPFERVGGESTEGERLVYRAVNSDSVEITKTFSKVDDKEPGGSYMLDYELTLRNTGPAAVPLDRWSVSLGSVAPLYQREWANQLGFFWRRDGKFKFISASKFKGGMFSEGKGVIEYSLEHLGYAGVSSQFFATVLRPAESYDSGIWAKGFDIKLPDGGGKSRKAVRAGIRLPSVQLAPGESKTIHFRLFMGPKENRMLRKMGHGYGDMMNYGWFSPVSRLLNWMLHWIHFAISKIAESWSWGLAIILLTIVLRGAMWPLQNASTRTMKRMSKLKPEMDKIKAKYPDDPNRTNQEMMKLYKKFHINPMGGCLPMFVQIPIFFGFYRMLQYAVELRGMGFLWVSDLSQPDTIMTIAGQPLNLLPIVMGITSFAQIAITPKTGDKNQQRIMMFMPLMFLVFCYNFAAALALYWTTSNLFAIGQTWLMNKLPEPELKERKTSSKGAKKTWMERLAEKQEEIQRSQRDQAAGRSCPLKPKDDKPKKKRPPRTGG
jgi:YidC/Oxa1 family membrane protein insertase